MLEVKEMIELMKAVSEYGLTKFNLEQGDTKLVIKREKDVVISSGLSHPEVEQYAEKHTGSVAVQSHVENTENEGKLIRCPLVGTFYSAPSPEAENFVKVGDHVKKGQIIGIVEAMKLMNEIECEYDGIVEAVLVENETIVEYGQPLIKIR